MLYLFYLIAIIIITDGGSKYDGKTFNFRPKLMCRKSIFKYNGPYVRRKHEPKPAF